MTASELHENLLEELNETAWYLQRDVSRIDNDPQAKEDLLKAITLSKQAADAILNTWLEPIFEPAARLFLEGYKMLSIRTWRLNSTNIARINSEAGNILQLAKNVSKKTREFIAKSSIEVEIDQDISPEARLMYSFGKSAGPYFVNNQMLQIIWGSRRQSSGLEEQVKRDLLTAIEVTTEAVDEILDIAVNSWGYTALELTWTITGMAGPIHRASNLESQRILSLAENLALKVNETISNYDRNIDSTSS